MEIQQGPGGRSVCAGAAVGAQAPTACGSLPPLPGCPSPTSLSQGGGAGTPSPLVGGTGRPTSCQQNFSWACRGCDLSSGHSTSHYSFGEALERTLQKVSCEKLSCQHGGFTDYKDCHREEGQARPVCRGDTCSHENLADKRVLTRHRNLALSSTYRRQLDLLSRQPSRRCG